jgi:hypothetical protein
VTAQRPNGAERGIVENDDVASKAGGGSAEDDDVVRTWNVDVVVKKRER